MNGLSALLDRGAVPQDWVMVHDAKQNSTVTVRPSQVFKLRTRAKS